MCLSKIIRTYKKPQIRPAYGRLHFEVDRYNRVKIMTPFVKVGMEPGQIHRASDGMIRSVYNSSYPAGFHRWRHSYHVPLELEGSLDCGFIFYLLVPGELREIHTLGIDQGRETYVGKVWTFCWRDLQAAARLQFDCNFDKMIQKLRRTF